MAITKRAGLASMALVGALGVEFTAQARVTGFEVVDTGDAYESQAFGDAGRYERIDAVAHFAIDPQSPRARAVVDLDKAAVDERGEVTFSTEVSILRPVDQDSMTLLYDVPNRGRNLALPLFNLSQPASGFSLDEPGDGFLMEQGYTLVWSGWQVGLDDASIRIDLPIAQGVTGPSREEFIFDDDEAVSVAALSYPAVSQDPNDATLTVRPSAGEPRRAVEPSSYRYLDDQHIEIQRPADMDGGAIYEFIYTARESRPSGLGMLATSDLVSFLRGAPGHDVTSPLEGVQHTLALGVSQSGRFLRDFIYQGFNADAQGQRVFDGAMAHIAGSRKTFTNARFAQPGRYSRQHEDHDVTGDQFPFSYVETEDLDGERDSVFAACRATDTCPQLMHTDTSTEFWQARSSLVSTAPNGEALRMPDDVRLYFFPGAQHFSPWGATPKAVDTCRFPSNPLSVAPSMRALVVALDAWVSEGREPPASRFPGLAGDEPLIDLEALTLPPLQGETLTPPVNELAVIDHDVLPPVAGERYTVKVPAVDADGIDQGGIRQPYVAAPLGTYLGWNLRDEGFAEGQLCGVTGSFIAFDDEGDTRPSATARYPMEQAYQSALSTAVDELVAAGFMLESDRELVMDSAPAR
ncbi:alpha/beta hydrolase domain-containing protein [Halomonas sp. HMF6819]|uniref:alpha/beta hydrolase domain-containing protein n=1 Tax=Halomonas sp. HMF6819 TaxID=3373085 RepID=UPI00379F6E4F